MIEPTPSRRRGRLRHGMAAVLAIAPMLIGATPAAADDVACASAEVTVVVAFNSLGDGTRIACTGDVSSGTAALTQTFGWVGTQRFPALVCRIGGVPLPEQDPCVDAPPETAYWTYWHARPGQSWTFSSVAAGQHNPDSGSFEGWAFGDRTPPSFDPANVVGSPVPEAEPTPPAPPGSPAAALATAAGVLVLGGVLAWQVRRRRSGPGSGPAQ